MSMDLEDNNVENNENDYDADFDPSLFLLFDQTNKISAKYEDMKSSV